MVALMSKFRILKSQKNHLLRTEIEEHVVTDLDLRNHENRPSLTSSAVAEERQDVSARNTIDEMADAITGGNDVGLWPPNIPEKMRAGILVEILNRLSLTSDEKSFLKHNVPQN